MSEKKFIARHKQGTSFYKSGVLGKGYDFESGQCSSGQSGQHKQQKFH